VVICGFPANNGAWSWDDEILVAFKPDNNQENQKGHSIGRGPTETVQVRSLDGGLTWAQEKPRGLQTAGEPQSFRGRLDFLDSDFSLRCGGGPCSSAPTAAKRGRSTTSRPSRTQSNTSPPRSGVSSERRRPLRRRRKGCTYDTSSFLRLAVTTDQELHHERSKSLTAFSHRLGFCAAS